MINSNTENPTYQSLKRKAWDEKDYNEATEEERKTYDEIRRKARKTGRGSSDD